MLRERMQLFKKLVYIADLSLVALSFQISVIVIAIRNGTHTNILQADYRLLPAVVIWGVVLWFHEECYFIRLREFGNIIFSLFKVSLISSGLFLMYIFVSGYAMESRLKVLLFAALSLAMLAALRLAITSFLRYYRSKGYNYQTAVIVGTGMPAKKFADRILHNSYFGWRIIGFIDLEKRRDLWRYRDIPCIGDLEALPDILKNSQVDWVVFAVNRKYLEKIESGLKICEQMGIQSVVLADFFPTRIARMKIGSFFEIPIVCYDTAPSLNLDMVIKSFIDRILAAVGLALSSPFMLLAALAVKLSSDGPAIFKQERCGLNGRKFTLYKFRTMVRNAESLKKDLMKHNEMDGAAFKMSGDPRITPLGSILRKTSMDELPQLFNVLKGDMSMVGPRPPLSEEVARYDLWQRRRLSMKPGLTGLWQVSGRSDVSFEQWMKLDLEYIDNWSLWTDAKIMAKTVPAVLKGSGAK